MKFKFIDDKHIDIINNDVKVGVISMMENNIQLCGFDVLEEYYGCGLYIDEKGMHKKDVTVSFNPENIGHELDEKERELFATELLENKRCGGCYNRIGSCICKDREEKQNGFFLEFINKGGK